VGFVGGFEVFSLNKLGKILESELNSPKIHRNKTLKRNPMIVPKNLNFLFNSPFPLLALVHLPNPIELHQHKTSFLIQID